MASTSVKDFQNNNPALFLVLLIGAGVFFLGKYIRFGGSGMSYAKRRALAKARRAKARKRRKNRR